ncbi:hypothetical protein [Pontiella agarivorans]|uniref:DUF4328 domain-containing protein n=1 Tax=Pontiella agarivorans TaxID=3038953 RepID=A0ABU5MYM3_9BACT|nr:hypothetical protein [Pontiella agarivorans]MDZ8119264.1 hypothetical protein [Pontiella agarivorans]
MNNTYGEFGATEAGMIIGVMLALLLLLAIPTIFWLLTLQKALGRCRVENQAMAPSMVWLMLIPLFNIVWQFILVINVSKSLKNEFESLNVQPDTAEPGKAVGLAMCILNVISAIPYLGSVLGIGSLICWIIHWVKIAGYSSQIASLHVEQAVFTEET